MPIEWVRATGTHLALLAGAKGRSRKSVGAPLKKKKMDVCFFFLGDAIDF